MALITCSNCGNPISDKATVCIHCGATLREKVVKKTICSECGSVLPDGTQVCPMCGCPVEDDTDNQKASEPQKVEVTKVQIAIDKKKRNVVVLAIAITVLCVIGGIFGKQQYDKKQAAEEAAEYKENLELAVATMWLGASKAETAASLIHDVWYNTIYEKEDSKTNKYTLDSKGSFHDDFNTSLLYLQIDDSFTKDIASIKSNQEEVQNYMKILKNPPNEYEEAYDALRKTYDAYTEIVNCAVNPSGNLSSYTSSFNQADSNAANALKAMEMYLGD